MLLGLPVPKYLLGMHLTQVVNMYSKGRRFKIINKPFFFFYNPSFRFLYSETVRR